jgi:hypothetical protein
VFQEKCVLDCFLVFRFLTTFLRPGWRSRNVPEFSALEVGRFSPLYGIKKDQKACESLKNSARARSPVKNV